MDESERHARLESIRLGLASLREAKAPVERSPAAPSSVDLAAAERHERLHAIQRRLGFAESTQLKFQMIQTTLFGGRSACAQPWQCDLCRGGFKSEQALISHAWWKHGVRKEPARALPQRPGALIQSFFAEEVQEQDLPEQFEHLISFEHAEEANLPELLEEEAAEEDEPLETPKKRTKTGAIKQTRGANRRQRVSAKQQVDAVDTWRACKLSGTPPKDKKGNATGTQYSYNTVYGWSRNYDKLVEQAAKGTATKLARTRRGWFRQNPLVQEFDQHLCRALKKHRKAGRPANSVTVLAMAESIYDKVDKTREGRNLQWPRNRRGGEVWRPKMTWVKSWLQVRGWKPRKPTKKRGSTPAQDSALMQRWLDKLRHMAQKQPSCGDNTWSDAWGFFSPGERFNRDQVGFSFDYTAAGRTWASPEERTTGCVQVVTGKAGWEKRFFTWDMCYAGDLKQAQPPPVLYFFGAGNISQLERASYDKDVKVFFTPKGYLNEDANQFWTQCWKEHVSANHAGKAVLLTCDNVAAHCTHAWREEMAKIGTTVLHGEPNGTHCWQAIDRHIGKTHKDLFHQMQLHRSLEDFKSFQHLSAKDRRIWCTHWVGDLWRHYCHEKAAAHANCCQCSGLLIRLDGVGDDRVTVESNPVFAVQPYQCWEGLEESIQKSWQAPAPFEEDASGSDSDSSSSTSSTSSSDSADSCDASPEPDGPESAQPGPPAGSSTEPQPAAGSGSTAWPGVGAALTRFDIHMLLKHAAKRHKLQAGVRMLAAHAKHGVKLDHPKALAGKTVPWDELRHCCSELKVELPSKEDI
ncbi:unnamed protein product [Effrenium voratum]|uniref:C2H2-type domain-containing protein n=1 Tax=Effrenium voratum TaxID=2562239 RepID=A0AA36J430_9DINO|nr:unnamed protein product [Effrenium voratum]